MEGAAIFKHAGSFYVFATYGSMGEDYTIRVCRSDTGPRGPFYDKDGRDCSLYPLALPPGSSMVLGPEGEQSVPGHPHIWEEDGTFYLGYDFRKGAATDQDDNEGIDYMAIRELHWIDDGDIGIWPTIWSPLKLDVLSDDHLDHIGSTLQVRLLNRGERKSQVGFDNIQFLEEEFDGISNVNTNSAQITGSFSYDDICMDTSLLEETSQTVCRAEMCGFCIMDRDKTNEKKFNVRCCCDAQCADLGDCCDSISEVCGE